MNGIISRKCNTEYFKKISEFSHIEIGKSISRYFEEIKDSNYTPVVLCIGTDRATGDCLGPLVGQKLLSLDCPFIVMGDLNTPIHALNLNETLYKIHADIANPFIIAVDASLGASTHVGSITVSNCPIAPGKGVNKKLPAVGNVSITGIVNVSGKSPALLQSTRLNIVMQLADCIANSIIYAIDYFEGF